MYHSGFESGVTEGPYDPSGRGVDRLVASLRSAGVTPGANVYAELGSTWWNLMRDPTQAAHVLGKLLVAVGTDNVLWGTDSLWYGSPQDQIQAFRAFEIATELQERHGYPALTAELKRKILGRNALALYAIEPPDAEVRVRPPRAGEAPRDRRRRVPYVRPGDRRELRALLRSHAVI